MAYTIASILNPMDEPAFSTASSRGSHPAVVGSISEARAPVQALAPEPPAEKVVYVGGMSLSSIFLFPVLFCFCPSLFPCPSLDPYLSLSLPHLPFSSPLSSSSISDGSNTQKRLLQSNIPPNRQNTCFAQHPRRPLRVPARFRLQAYPSL